MTKKISTNTMTDEELDKLFCMNGKKYGVKKLLLKAVAITESSLDEHAYRFEPNFYDKYLKNKPEWAGKDPSEISASYGLMQLMYTTAWGLGFRGPGEDLYNPVYNVELGAKLLRTLLKACPDLTGMQLWPIEVALARYNGGSYLNPGPDGKLRNQKYVDRVFSNWSDLKKAEKECDDE